MKIGLVSSESRDNDVEFNVNQIKRYIRENRDVDLLCFGESFLQGFEGLCWAYEEDYIRAFSKDDEVIKELRKLARDYKTALSFGFIEKY